MAEVPKNCDEQYDILKRRNLTIDMSEADVKAFLTENNYFRFKGYFSKFLIVDPETNEDKFTDGVTFQQLKMIYDGDTRFRRIIGDLLEVVEIYLKTIFVLFLSNNFNDPDFLYDKRYFFVSHDGTSKLDKVLINIDKYISVHKDSPVIIKYTDKSTGICKLPSWAFIDFLSFGDVSMLFESLLSVHTRDLNNKYFKIPNKSAREYLASWTKGICKLRNISHHYEKLYSIKLLQSPPKILNNRDINKYHVIDQFNQTSVFNSILTATLICPNKSVVNKMVYEFKELQSSNSVISLINDYGFPADWENILINLSGALIKTRY